MLELAIKAQIPIIKVHTTDLLNLPDILSYLAPGKTVVEVKSRDVHNPADVVYTTESFPITKGNYESVVSSGRVLILVNPENESPFTFDAGEVPVPKKLKENLLAEVLESSDIPEILPSFNGLTLKTMAEVMRLTTARDNSLTPLGVSKTRAMIVGKIQGLEQVNSNLSLYLCPPHLKDWVKKNKSYFLEGKDERLVPRGILLNGSPGVGKSQGSKYIANQFGVPLYRLDLSSALGKWVGESEAAFSRILNTVDQEDKCILLVDEVEKLFSETEDQGVTARLLSQFLWWLSEHRSRVLTVMTTNNVEALPRELYRAGRVDLVMTIAQLDFGQAIKLAEACLKQFGAVTKLKKDLLVGAVDNIMRMGTLEYKPISHATVVQVVYDLIKENEWV